MKEFNTTGVCIPSLHYMMDTSKKMEGVFDLIKGGKYFTINRPRQFGKTTTLHTIDNYLQQQEDYLIVRISFEGISQTQEKDEYAFSNSFVKRFLEKLALNYPSFYKKTKNYFKEIEDSLDLSLAITQFIKTVNRKVVLLIDEADAGSDFTTFLRFLAMLRSKYLDRTPNIPTFHSVILAGVHDIKNLQYKIRTNTSGQGSPWNIATDFKIDMTFNPKEIAPMLEDYSKAEEVEMNISEIAEKLYYYTSGYPFLVSRLCEIIAKDILPYKIATERNWSLEDVNHAVQLILKEENTNFNSLIKNLEIHQDLYNLVYRVLLKGEKISYNPDEPVTSLGRMYGVFKLNGSLKIHNRIYEQRIYNYLILKTVVNNNWEAETQSSTYISENNTLNMEKVLLKFQAFMKSEFSEKDTKFLEREGRLVFLSFLDPILNGHGHTFKEAQISYEQRLDIVITFYQYLYVLELKRWRGKVYHEEGLAQLEAYLEAKGLDIGFLLIFDFRKSKNWSSKWLETKEKKKKVFAVWV